MLVFDTFNRIDSGDGLHGNRFHSNLKKLTSSLCFSLFFANMGILIDPAPCGCSKETRLIYVKMCKALLPTPSTSSLSGVSDSSTRRAHTMFATKSGSRGICESRNDPSDLFLLGKPVSFYSLYCPE